MLRTRVGYCGGNDVTPTYYSMGDHTEGITIDYDPEVISYNALLDLFWRAHTCSQVNSSRQYMNAVFYRNEEQHRLAEASLEREVKRRGISRSVIQTKIVPMKSFTYAEGYHHKYYLSRHHDIRKFLEKTYPDTKSFADSTVAMKLNAYLGSGMKLDWESFLSEIPQFDLPEMMEKRLTAAVQVKLP